MSQKKELFAQYKALFELINEAFATNNPFRAKALKDEIKPMFEQFATLSVETLCCQMEEIEILKEELRRLDGRMFNLGG